MIPKKLLPILLGKVLESYDFFLYGLLSVYFAKIFFPQSANSLTYSFLLFSTAYLARPLGSVLWGHMGDKYGRKPVLMGTLSLMAIPAIGMAIMPSYENIGVIASFLVIFLRFLQGISYGGESPAIMVAMYEVAPKDKKGFYSSFCHPSGFVGYFIGIVLIIILTALLGQKNIQTFGWRLMFGLSLIFIVLLSYMRLRLIETSKTEYQPSFPLLMTLKHDLGSILKIFLYLSGSAVMLYNLLFHNYLIIWAADFGAQSLFLQACIVALIIFLMPCVGYFSDKTNKINLLKTTYIIVFFLAPFLYSMFLTKDLMWMMIGYSVFAIFTCIAAAFSPAIIVPQASKYCRVSTVGLGVSFSVLFGSFIPAINELLKKLTNIPISPSLLISLCAAISLITLYTLKNKEEIR